MEIKKILFLCSILFIAGCSSSMEHHKISEMEYEEAQRHCEIMPNMEGCEDFLNQNKELTNSEVMMAIHCEEMWMSGCEEFEGIELTQEQIEIGCNMMPNMGICSELLEESIEESKEPMFTPIDSVQKAKESQVIELEDGDRLDLSIDIVTKEIAGSEIKMFGYNGQIPGPLLRVNQDSTVYVNVTNNLDYNTTVHWHGLRLENEFDGVPGSTMNVQKPGDSFEYKLDFPDEGIYWYHPHVREDIQQELGLYGNMLVDSKYDDYYNNVNQEIPIILDDILIEDGNLAPLGDREATRTLMGRFGNVMLVNGDEDYSLEINTGDVIRFYITNVANTRTFNFSIEGAQIKLVGSDVGSYEMEEYVNSVIIAPAERYTIEAYFENEGEYDMKNINPHEEYDLGKVIVTSETENDYSTEFLSLRENIYVKEDIDNFREYFDKEVDVKIDITVDMMGMNMGSMLDGLNEEQRREHCEMMPGMMECGQYLDEDEEHELKGIEWEDEMEMMNQMSDSKSVKWILKDSETEKENMGIDLGFKVGDKVKIRLFNDPKSMHPMQHPIHFHGQRFLVLEKDGEKNKNLVWKDTVLVPVGSTVDILLDVTNPGEWMAHCHIAEHLESGMMLSFNVEE